MTKKELSQLYWLKREIEEDRRRLDELEAIAASPASPRYDGMPHAPGAGDGMARMAAEIVPFYLIHDIAGKAVRLFVYSPVFDERPLFSFGLWLCILLASIVFSRLYYVIQAVVKKQMGKGNEEKSCAAATHRS